MTTTLTNDQTQALLQLLIQNRLKHTTPVTPAPVNPLHGDQGLLSLPGMAPGVVNATILPTKGLWGMLPLRWNNHTDYFYGVLTGIDDATGAEPVSECDALPVAGVARLCTRFQPFGWVGRSSSVTSLKDVGRLLHRGEFTDYRLVGNPFGRGNSPLTMANRQAILRDEHGKKMLELAAALLFTMCPDTFTGDPANNTGGGGREFYKGLDLLYITGSVDAVTGTACAAADSDVRDALTLAVPITDVNTESLETVNELVSMYQTAQQTAMDTGLDPLVNAFVMRSGLFYEIAKIWPCAFQTARCQNVNQPGDVRTVLSADMQNQMFIDMWNGKYLLIDGVKVPVIIDNCIPTDPAVILPQRRSDIYMVPLYAGNGSRSRPLSEGGSIATYKDYFPMNERLAFGRAQAPNGTYAMSDDGQFLIFRHGPDHLCTQISMWTQQRLMSEVPQLAGRFVNVTYTPQVLPRNWDPAGPNYFGGGDATYAPLPTLTP